MKIASHRSFRADRLRAIRAHKGWSQNQLAQRSGIDPSRIARYEKDGAEPTAHNLRLICDALDVTADFLLGRDTLDARFSRELAVSESLALFIRHGRLDDDALRRLHQVARIQGAPQTVADWQTALQIAEIDRKKNASSGQSRRPQRESGRKVRQITPR
jgi:transcriptional regulator with XRE-family HTH domain